MIRLLLVFSIAFSLCLHPINAQNWDGFLAQADSFSGTLQFDSATIYGSLSIEIAEKTLSDSILFAYLLDSVATFYYQNREFSNAILLCEQSLMLKERASDPDPISISKTMRKLAIINIDLGKFYIAEPYILHTLTLTENTLGDSHPETARLRYLLGLIYKNQGKYFEAESEYSKSLDILQFHNGVTSQEAAEVYNDLGNLYDSQGKYLEAELYNRKALSIQKKLYGGTHISLGSSLHNLAVLAFKQAKYYEADSLFKQAMDIIEELVGSNHPQYAKTISGMATSKMEQEDYSSSERYYLKALSIFEEFNGKDHLAVADILNRTGYLYILLGRYDEAEPILKRALSIKQRIFGSDHKQTAFALHRLGNLYYCQGKYGMAKPCYISALGIIEDVLTPIHPIVIEFRLNLAKLYASTGKFEQSRHEFVESLQMRRKFMEYVFSSSSEMQKLRWINKYPLIETPLLSLALLDNDPETIKQACNMVLYGKSSVIDAVMAEKKAGWCSKNSEVIKRLKAREELYSEIAELTLRTMAGGGGLSANDRLQSLSYVQDSLETELALICKEFNDSLKVMRLGVSEVVRAMSDDEVVVDFIRYYPYSFQSNGNDQSRTLAPHYIAFVITNDSKIGMLDLGEANVIDSLISLIRDLIYQSQVEIYTSRIKLSENRILEFSGQLYSKILRPILETVSGKSSLYISPDGLLNLFPFEILPLPDRTYLLEKFRIGYLSSVRDFTRYKSQLNSDSAEALVFADPNFDYNYFDKTAPKDSDSSIQKESLHQAPNRIFSNLACLGEKYSRLRFSRKEAVSIANSIRGHDNFQVHEYYGINATERSLKMMSRPPEILHLSTHGFICEGTFIDKNVFSINPLLKSGLVLAGANHSIGADSESFPHGEDGILTAFEVSSLNLVGTELATLSACETGIGELIHGEGVFSLRRAFQHAGAISILMSLWKVPDKQTSELMEKFYENWLGGMSKQDALRNAALKILDESRKEMGSGHPLLWGGFVLTGNPE